jgi:hypothetical protein
LAFQIAQVAMLRAEKSNLEMDISQLKANVSRLEAKGGRIELSNCGGRLCIVADSNQSGQGESDYKNWKGAIWSNKETGNQLVIPKGY